MHRYLTGALLSAALALPAAAQQPGGTITFDQAIEIALRQNGALRLAEAAARADAITVRERRSVLLPTLDLTTRGTQQVGRSFDQSEGRVATQTSQTVNAGVSSSMVVWDGGANRIELQQARLGEQAGQAELARARQTVVFTVASDFLTLVEQQEQVRVRREDLQAQQALEGQIKEFVDAGSRPISDLYQQQAAVASARLQLVQAERALELAKVELIRTLQLDPFGEYAFVAPEGGAPPVAPAALDSLLRVAFARRVDLRAGEVRIQAAQQGVRAARAGSLPTVSLTAGYNTSFNSTVESDFLDQFNDRRGGSVGVGVALPLFDRGATRNATARAQVQLDQARIDQENLRQEVALQVRRASLDVRAAGEQRRAAEAQVAAARLALEAARERYEVGAATLVERSQAQAVLVQAESALVSARYSEQVQTRLLAYYLGELDPGS